MALRNELGVTEVAQVKGVGYGLGEAAEETGSECLGVGSGGNLYTRAIMGSGLK